MTSQIRRVEVGNYISNNPHHVLLCCVGVHIINCKLVDIYKREREVQKPFTYQFGIAKINLKGGKLGLEILFKQLRLLKQGGVNA